MRILYLFTVGGSPDLGYRIHLLTLDILLLTLVYSILNLLKITTLYIRFQDIKHKQEMFHMRHATRF